MVPAGNKVKCFSWPTIPQKQFIIIIIIIIIIITGDQSFKKTFFKNKFYGSFSYMGFNCFKARREPLQGHSLLFTTKFPGVPGTHFISLRRMRMGIKRFNHQTIFFNSRFKDFRFKPNLYAWPSFETQPQCKVLANHWII